MPEPVGNSGLKLWQRFHIKLSAMYGVLVLGVLLSVAAVFYVRGVDREMTALRAKISIATQTLGAMLSPADIADLHTATDVDKPNYKRLMTQFSAVAASEADFSDVYIMRVAANGGLELVVDDVIIADAPSAKPGDPYEVQSGMVIRQGFTKPIVEPAIYTDAWGTVLSGYAPIRDTSGNAVAIVGIDVRATRVDALKHEVRLVVLAVLAVALGLLAILAVIVARIVRKPLAQIVDATNAIAAGQLHVRAQVQRQDEFGVVGKHFDNMAHGLEEREFIKTTFGQYVAPEVVKRMLTDRSHAVHGQRRHAAVMFVDIRGFTTVSEGMEPEGVVSLLNDYLERMTNVITRHGGRIDKFIGDAIMADWGSLDDDPRPEDHAVATGLAMLAELDEWNAERVASGKAPLDLGLAIHAGPVVAGTIGSQKKLEFTVVGDTVNVASRLEGMCKTFGARFVVSGAVISNATTSAKTRWLDTLVLRGRSEPTDVYQVLAPDDPRCSLLDEYDAAAELLKAGDRAQANVAFRALRERGADATVDHQIERSGDRRRAS